MLRFDSWIELYRLTLSLTRLSVSARAGPHATARFVTAVTDAIARLGENGTKQEARMTLTILDPRTGQRVTIAVPDRAAVQQPTPALVIDHPRLSTGRAK